MDWSRVGMELWITASVLFLFLVVSIYMLIRDRLLAWVKRRTDEHARRAWEALDPDLRRTHRASYFIAAIVRSDGMTKSEVLKPYSKDAG